MTFSSLFVDVLKILAAMMASSFDWTLSHQQYDHQTPENEQRVADGIGDGIAEGRRLALRCVLNQTEGGSGGSRAEAAPSVIAG